MDQRKKWMAVSVTTKEALRMCLKNQVVLLCIENPLYTTLKGRQEWCEAMDDYQLTEDPEKQIILAKKVRGEICFDEEQYEVYYYPLA